MTEQAYLPITEENIVRIDAEALASGNYGANFAVIRDVLRRFPRNIDREVVAMKLAVIDLTHSTNLGKQISRLSLSDVVDEIVHIRDFDSRLSQGDPSLVNQLAGGNGKVNLFSLASKYCACHNAEVYERDDYSIFDRVVRDALPHYVPALTVAAVERWRKGFRYEDFNRSIGELLDRQGIALPFRRRRFDRFLWYANRSR